MHEQCCEQWFLSLHSESMWGYCSHVGKKKKKKKRRKKWKTQFWIQQKTLNPNAHIVTSRMIFSFLFLSEHLFLIQSQMEWDLWTSYLLLKKKSKENHCSLLDVPFHGPSSVKSKTMQLNWIHSFLGSFFCFFF